MTATHPAAAARAARMASLKTERRRPWRRTSSTASQATTNPTSSCTRPSIIFASPPWPLALRHGIKPFFLPEECEVATTASNRGARSVRDPIGRGCGRKVGGKRGAERRWCGIADWCNGEERMDGSGVGKRWRAISGGSEGGGRPGWGGKGCGRSGAAVTHVRVQIP